MLSPERILGFLEDPTEQGNLALSNKANVRFESSDNDKKYIRLLTLAKGNLIEVPMSPQPLDLLFQTTYKQIGAIDDLSVYIVGRDPEPNPEDDFITVETSDKILDEEEFRCRARGQTKIALREKLENIEQQSRDDTQIIGDYKEEIIDNMKEAREILMGNSADFFSKYASELRYLRQNPPSRIEVGLSYIVNTITGGLLRSREQNTLNQITADYISWSLLRDGSERKKNQLESELDFLKENDLPFQEETEFLQDFYKEVSKLTQDSENRIKRLLEKATMLYQTIGLGSRVSDIDPLRLRVLHVGYSP